MLEMFFNIFLIVGVVAIIFAGGKWAMWLYNQRGSAMSDDPDGQNHPVIKGSSDAWAQRQIDEAKESKKK